MNRDIPQRERVMCIASTLYDAGRGDEAMRYAQELLASTDRNGSYRWKALSLLADVAGQADDAAGALEYARQALETARDQENQLAQVISLGELGDLSLSRPGPQTRQSNTMNEPWRSSKHARSQIAHLR